MTRKEIIDTLEQAHRKLTRDLETAYVTGKISKESRDSIAYGVLYEINSALGLLRKEERAS